MRQDRTCINVIEKRDNCFIADCSCCCNLKQNNEKQQQQQKAHCKSKTNAICIEFYNGDHRRR